MFSKIAIYSLLIVFCWHLAVGKILIRSKRQVEREGVAGNESVVVVDSVGDRGPAYEVPVQTEKPDTEKPDTEKPDTDEMEIDFDPNDGSFSFGGKFPPLFPGFPTQNNHNHNHNNNHGINLFSAFDSYFRKMQQRFDEMMNRMHSTVNMNGTANLPPNYNDTKEEVVTMDGKQYIKKTHIIKKTRPGVNVFLTSVSYEPVDDKSNEAIREQR